MALPMIAVSSLDQKIDALVRKSDHKLLAFWAADCAERVLPLFEKKSPGDDRPRKAIEACREWARTGVFKMAAVRKASLDAHTAARAVISDNTARSSARAAGQAMATAHVYTHSIAASRYAATAVRDSSKPADSISATENEREWQYHHLLELRKSL